MKVETTIEPNEVKTNKILMIQEVSLKLDDILKIQVTVTKYKHGDI